MKKISRMIIFSAIAIYFTSLWNRGFIIDYSLVGFTKAILIVTLIYYLIFPIVKLLLLPLNILTMGLASLVVYFFIFYFFINRYGIAQISAWKFNGLTIGEEVINPIKINYSLNVVLTALSISTIINLIDSLL